MNVHTTRESWDDYFMRLAMAARTRGTCPRRQVGCVLVDKDNRVISTGYNGSPPGAAHCIDAGCHMSHGHCIRTIHAEINALALSGRLRSAGSRIYCTSFPCVACAKRVTTSGPIEFIYMDPYPEHEEGVLNLFKENGIVIRQHSIGE